MKETKLISVHNPSTNKNELVEVNEEVAKTIKHFDNKENYLSKGLKAPKYIINDNKVTIVKSREASLEFLHSQGIDFKGETEIYAEIEQQTEVQDYLSNFDSLLSEKEKQVIILYVYEEYTEEEIATMLDISQSTVHYRKANAFKKIKKYYENKNV